MPVVVHDDLIAETIGAYHEAGRAKRPQPHDPPNDPVPRHVDGSEQAATRVSECRSGTGGAAGATDEGGPKRRLAAPPQSGPSRDGATGGDGRGYDHRFATLSLKTAQ